MKVSTLLSAAALVALCIAAMLVLSGLKENDEVGGRSVPPMASDPALRPKPQSPQDERAAALKKLRADGKGRASSLCAKHPGWTVFACETVAAGKFSLGMSRDQIRAVFGAPNGVTREVRSGSVWEAWEYHNDDYSRAQTFYFSDGALVDYTTASSQ